MLPIHHRRARHALVLMAVCATSALVVACDDSPTTPVIPVDWTANLTGSEQHADVEGTADVVSIPALFEAEIEIANAEADAVYTWHVAAGTCAEPGDRIGSAASYPDLEVAADGTASAEADVSATLDNDGKYIVFVLDESGDEPVVVACGVLQLVYSHAAG